MIIRILIIIIIIMIIIIIIIIIIMIHKLIMVLYFHGDILFGNELSFVDSSILQLVNTYTKLMQGVI